MFEGLSFDVSRETLQNLRSFEQDLISWSRRINLVAKSTIDDVWNRHILDSAQLFEYAKPTVRTWTDIGSGGGLPALVLSIIAKQKAPDVEFALIESDQRKAAFLRATTAKYNLNNRILAERVEDIAGLNSDVLSARAFAPLDRLLGYAVPHIATNGRIVLLKGSTSQQEIEIAAENWNFDVVTHPSLTDSRSLILEITNVASKT